MGGNPAIGVAVADGAAPTVTGASPQTETLRPQRLSELLIKHFRQSEPIFIIVPFVTPTHPEAEPAAHTAPLADPAWAIATAVVGVGFVPVAAGVSLQLAKLRPQRLSGLFIKHFRQSLPIRMIAPLATPTHPDAEPAAHVPPACVPAGTVGTGAVGAVVVAVVGAGLQRPFAHPYRQD